MKCLISLYSFLKTIDERINDETQQRGNLKESLLSEIKTVDDFTKKQEKDEDAYRKSLLYCKTVCPAANSEEEGIE